jgi:hypothetical protein
MSDKPPTRLTRQMELLPSILLERSRPSADATSVRDNFMNEQTRRLAEKIALGASFVIALIGLLILNWLFFRGKR